MSLIKNKQFLDLAERSAATFAQSFLAVEIADQNGITQLESLKIAAVAGVLAVAKFAYSRVNLFLASPSNLTVTVKTSASTEPTAPVA